jgi:arylsulfatase A-like enzyme
VCVVGSHALGDDGGALVAAPAWLVAHLQSGAADALPAALARITPSLAVRVSLRPHRPDFLADAAEPAEALRRALESYTCLSAGCAIPLAIRDSATAAFAGEPAHQHKEWVDVVATVPAGVVCVRGVEVEVEVLPPEEPAPPAAAAAAAPAAPAAAAAAPGRGHGVIHRHGGPPVGRGATGAPTFQAFSGRAYRLDGKPT